MRVPHLGQGLLKQGTPLVWGSEYPQLGQVHMRLPPKPRRATVTKPSAEPHRGRWEVGRPLPRGEKR